MKTKPKADASDRKKAAADLHAVIWHAMSDLASQVVTSSLDGTIIRTRKFAHIDPKFEIYIEIRSRIG